MGETFTERVAREVRYEMARHGMSQERLAAAVGMSQSTLSRRLCAELPFDVAELDVIAAVLGVSVDRFMRGQQGMVPPSQTTGRPAVAGRPVTGPASQEKELMSG